MRDVTHVLQSDWPAKICARGSKAVGAVWHRDYASTLQKLHCQQKQMRGDRHLGPIR